ncbi:iron-sulfur cluster repair di-iron protein [Salinispira pacifica]
MASPSTIRTIGSLVAESPERARLFEALGIDYCCSGNRTMEEAARDAGIDEATLERLFAAFEARQPADSGPRLADLSTEELVDHIVETHHRYLRTELPRLSELAAKVSEGHGERDERLADVQALVASLSEELLSHLDEEERSIFPSLPDGITSGDLSRMRSEHSSVGAALERLSSLTDGYTPPEWACNTYRAFLSGLSELEKDTHNHVHTENNLLFARVESKLSLRQPL